MLSALLFNNLLVVRFLACAVGKGKGKDQKEKVIHKCYDCIEKQCIDKLLIKEYLEIRSVPKCQLQTMAKKM
jgi:hypothetical protein